MAATYPAINDFIIERLPRRRGAQADFAAKVGTTAPNASRWLKSETSPSEGYWPAIAAYFDVPLGVLEELAEQGPRPDPIVVAGLHDLTPEEAEAAMRAVEQIRKRQG